MTLTSQLSAQFFSPSRFSLNSTVQDTFLSKGLLSNIIAEVRLMGDSLTWFGTGQGLALHNGHYVYSHQITTDSLADGQTTKLVPYGGIPAIAVMGDTMAVAYSGDNGSIQVGYGLTLTYDAQMVNDSSGITWTYLQQPIDQESDTLPPFGEGFYRALPVTVPEANVTYDAYLFGNYLWTASWAGGLRRFKFSDQVWERVPLPMDNQYELTTCKDTSYVRVGGKYILKDYYLNPRDPLDGGNHNHKAFSVLSYGDTIWVGTANGINRGILGSGNCIDWEHYSYPMDNLSGNFVVGLEAQRLNGKRIIWAATVNADDPTEQRGLSYTIDDGLSWNTALLGERIYNIASFDSLVFAASANGLWKTEDGINWALYNPAHQAIPVPNTAIYDIDEVLADEVYSVAFDDRPYYGDRSIWIGTGDGAAHSYDLDGLNWKIFRAEYDINEDYAYPNPFSPYTHNVRNDNGYVRFHTNEWPGTFVIDIDIYNFAMEKVYAGSFDKRISSSGALKWDGRDQQGAYVHNGVYFVKLTYPENQSSKPSPHWVKLIVVK